MKPKDGIMSVDITIEIQSTCGLTIVEKMNRDSRVSHVQMRTDVIFRQCIVFS